MVGFKWNLLYDVANNLIQYNDDEYLRTATNRYYYSSYNEIRNYLINKGQLDSDLKYNVHQKILNILKKSDNPRENLLYHYLVFLKQG